MCPSITHNDYQTGNAECVNTYIAWLSVKVPIPHAVKPISSMNSSYFIPKLV